MLKKKTFYIIFTTLWPLGSFPINFSMCFQRGTGSGEALLNGLAETDAGKVKQSFGDN